MAVLVVPLKADQKVPVAEGGVAHNRPVLRKNNGCNHLEPLAHVRKGAQILTNEGRDVAEQILRQDIHAERRNCHFPVLGPPLL